MTGENSRLWKQIGLSGPQMSPSPLIRLKQCQSLGVPLQHSHLDEEGEGENNGFDSLQVPQVNENSFEIDVGEISFKHKCFSKTDEFLTMLLETDSTRPFTSGGSSPVTVSRRANNNLTLQLTIEELKSIEWEMENMCRYFVN